MSLQSTRLHFQVQETSMSITIESESEVQSRLGGLAVVSSALSNFAAQKLNEVTKDIPKSLICNRMQRNGPSCFHMNLLTAKEVESLSEETLRSFRVALVGETFLPLAIGKNYQCFYIIVAFPVASSWRRKCGLAVKDFHVTLAFSDCCGRHNLCKDTSTSISYFTLSEQSFEDWITMARSILGAIRRKEETTVSFVDLCQLLRDLLRVSESTTQNDSLTKRVAKL